MANLVKYTFWLAMIGVFFIVAGYYLVLPHLGRSTVAVTVTGLTGDPKRGAYVATAAGCLTCHTDYKHKGKLLAGGPAIKTPFGTFYGPNITPDENHGIGGWSLEQFSKVLTTGVAPNGNHYFPSFPYASYALMKAQDIADIKSYLSTVAAVGIPSRRHDLPWPFSDRNVVGAWKFINFNPVDAEKMTRGAYLVNVLGHCTECHTQRDLLGGKTGVSLAGNTNGPSGARIPGLRGLATDATPWTAENIKLSLQVGMKPNGDFLGGTMAEVVEHSTAKLSGGDRAEIAKYLLSLK
ncbi:MAG: mono/diheme cytochrome c family protein [Alphaproteobacteria bacterium]|jgi:mono/diheme cytochrome c family protein